MSTQLHPLTAAICIATAALLTGMSFSAEPHVLDVSAAVRDQVVVKPEGAADSPSQPSAECPDYARVLADRSGRRLLVVVTFTGCVYCEQMMKDLDAHGIAYIEVNRERNPGTFNSFHAAKYPTWYVIRNGETASTGAGKMPADFFKQILE